VYHQPLKNIKQKINTTLMMTLIILFYLHLPQKQLHAHKLQQTRIIHLLFHHNQLEIYINLLTPKTNQMTAWISFFDNNKNGQLNAQEQLKLGIFLKQWIIRKFIIKNNNKKLIIHFKELQNSKLRGNPRRKSYSWDYHFQIKNISQTKIITLNLSVPLLFPNELIPIAITTTKHYNLLKTKTSLPIRKKQYAICRIDKNQKKCLFKIKKNPNTTNNKASFP